MDTLIFLHIPKTAGTTFRSILPANYRAEELYNVPTNAEGQVDFSGLDRLSDVEKRKIRVLAGHFQYGAHEHLPQKSSYITILRDPVKRIISRYYHAVREVPGWTGIK